MKFELCFEAPESVAGQRISIADELIVGRAKGCGVRIQDPRVSRCHARISMTEDGVLVEDLGSPNGTVVNGLRVARQVLTEGDLIAFGQHRLRVGRVGATKPSHSTGELIKPVVTSFPSVLEDRGKAAFFEALGLGDVTQVDIGVSSSAQLLQKTRQFAVLHEISGTLRASHTPRGMLGRLLDSVLRITEGDRGFVVLSDSPSEGATTEDRGEHEAADTSPPLNTGSSVFHVDIYRTRESSRASEAPRVSRTVTQHVLSERCAILSHDPEIDERFAASNSLFLSRTRALMAVPILLRDEILGALVVESEKSEAFSEADLDLLTLISSTVGQTLENLRLAQKREETIKELEEAQANLLATREQLVRSEQLAVIGRLASGLAHEVKNHLSPFTLADMIARKYPDDKETQMAVEMMLEARQHIVDLVSEVKGFARGLSETRAERTEAADVAQLCEAVARFARCDAAVKRHELTVVALQDPWAELDVPRIRQVVINLVKNAADAIGSEAGGRIELRIRELDGWAFIDVEDNGPGIPADVGARIFEPFFSTKGDKGLGLGLDISSKIAEAHGGTLGFSSELGHGTTFTLQFPALPE